MEIIIVVGVLALVPDKKTEHVSSIGQERGDRMDGRMKLTALLIGVELEAPISTGVGPKGFGIVIDGRTEEYV
jgi:hypothetical protein